MQFRSYNMEAKIATSLLMNLLNNIVIGRYNRDKVSQKTILVPIVYGTRSRVLKELENINKNLKPPIIAVVKENISRDQSRLNETYSHLKSVASGHTVHERMRGIPINIDFTVSGIAVYEDDIDQIVSNFIPFFKPDVFVSWKHPKFPSEEIKSQIVWNGTINYQSPVDITERDHEFYQFETSFTFKTWFFAGLLDGEIDDGPLIEKVNYTANEFFNVGDEGYGSFKVYAIPKAMKFSDFIENMNNGYLDDEGDIISYPRIIKAPSDDIVVSYPPSTRFTAMTMKISLLDENKEDANYDPNVFGFNADSKLRDCNMWHVKTNIEVNNRGNNRKTRNENDFEYNYIGNSTWSDDFIDIEVNTSISSNYDWLSQYPSGPYVSCPCNITTDYGRNWKITDSSGNNSNATALFTDSDIEYIGPQLSCVSWMNLWKRRLNVKRICITAGSNPSLAPIGAVMEGYSKDTFKWKIIKRISITEPWTANETKVFDYEDDEQEYDALRVTFGKPQGGGENIAVKTFRCYSVLDYSKVPEGYKSTRHAVSKYEISFKAHGDENSSILLSREVSTENSSTTTDVNEFGSAITLADNDCHMLMKPNLEDLTPVMFDPTRYLLFWYKGRKYGFSVGGNINRGKAQSITYGDQFPINVKNGSMHVLTSTPGTPIFQYDAEHDVWFEIGNQTRAGYQKTIITSESGEKTINIERGNSTSFSFNEYQTEFSTQYFNVYISSQETGIASLSLITNGNSIENSNYDCEVGPTPTLHRIPIIVSGTISSLSVSLLELGTTVSSISLTKFMITGKLDEADYFNNPEFCDIEVKNLLLNS